VSFLLISPPLLAFETEPCNRIEEQETEQPFSYWSEKSSSAELLR
jgi:hypothetical protein